MWEYRFSRKSIKILKKLDKKVVNLINKKLKNIGNWLDNVEPLHSDIKKLKGEWKGFYRLRVGEIRIIFTVDDKDGIIKIYEIGYRQSVYNF